MSFDARETMLDKKAKQSRAKARSASGLGEEVVTERPAWLYPLIIFGVILTFCTVIVYMYFGPSVEDLAGNTPVGSSRSRIVKLVVDNVHLRIPENYTRFPRDRRGGKRDSVSLYAMLPNFEPFRDRLKNEFYGNAPNSSVVQFDMHVYHAPLSEEEQLRYVYLPRVTDPRGTEGPAGLRQYTFADGTSYRGRELFVGRQEGNAVAVIRCEVLSEKIPSPNCQRDTRLANKLGLIYRFKRAHLNKWREIDAGIKTLAAKFEAGEGEDTDEPAS